jgi:thiol-disulfide isomerase/thioredoxin
VALLVVAVALIAASNGGVALTTLRGDPYVACSASGETTELLHFWATWCPSCREDLLSLERASRDCGDQVRILVVNVGEAAETIEAFLADHRLEMPMLRDASGVAIRQAGGRGLPMNLVCRGDVRKTLVGPLDAAGWRDQLRWIGCEDAADRPQEPR